MEVKRGKSYGPMVILDMADLSKDIPDESLNLIPNPTKMDGQYDNPYRVWAGYGLS